MFSVDILHVTAMYGHYDLEISTSKEFGEMDGKPADDG